MNIVKKIMIYLAILGLPAVALAAEKQKLPGPGTAQTASSQRIIRNGDTLNINVWQHKDLSMTAIVDEGGNIEYLFAGLIPVAGKTIAEVKEILRKGISENYIADPKIDIVLDRKSLTFFAAGEVQRPGTYEFRPGMTALEAIALAGGFTDYASRRVRVVRRDVNGKEKELKINTKKLLRATDKRDQSSLQVDDIIVVDRAWW